MFDLKTVKEHLRIEHTLEDSLISSYMDAAKDFAENFLGRQLDSYQNLPGAIWGGLLIHTALLYESREGEFMEKNLRAIKLLYWPYRKVEV